MPNPAINIVLCDARDDAARLVGALTALAAVQPGVSARSSLKVLNEVARLLHGITDNIAVAEVAMRKEAAHG